MKSKRHIVVLHGAVPPDGPPDEQDMLDEVQAVSDALKRLGYSVESLPLTLDLHTARTQFARRRSTLVFNLVESIGGSGRLAPLGAALLEEVGSAYTGAPMAGLFLSSNKLLAKRLLAMAGIDTPAWCSNEVPPHGERAQRWIVKSVWEHASIGIDDDSVVGASRVPLMLAARRERLGGEWFAESYIEGREFNIAMLEGPDGLQVLPPAEIHFIDFPCDKPQIVGYAAKWSPDSFEYGHTPRRFDFADAERPLLATLTDIAQRCWSLFECRGYARVDFRVDRDSRPWVLEVNANPCLAPEAGFIAAAARADMSYDDMIARIIQHVDKSS